MSGKERCHRWRDRELRGGDVTNGRQSTLPTAPGRVQTSPHARLSTLERIPVVASPRDEPVLVCQAGIWAFGGQHVRQATRHLRDGGQEVF